MQFHALNNAFGLLMLLVDNKSGKVIPGRKKNLMRELSLFSDEEDQPKVSQQLQLAIMQYLNTGNSCCNYYIEIDFV